LSRNRISTAAPLRPSLRSGLRGVSVAAATSRGKIVTIKVEDIQKLRKKTGVGIMDAKTALKETKGNLEKAIELLRKKGLSKAQKRANREAKEGIVSSYIHAGGRVGAMVELLTETDFVAKTDGFKGLAYNIAMQVAAMDPEYATVEDIPKNVIEKEKEIEREKLRKEKKPDDIINKILDGKMENYYKEIVLIKQPFIKDEKKTIEDLIAEAVTKLGENIKIGRFARFQIK